MKVNDDDLKKHYREYLREERSPDRVNCPQVQELLALFRKKGRIHRCVVDHLAGCPFCAEEFEFIRELLKAEKELLDDLEPILKDKRKKTIKPAFFPSFPRKLIPYAVAAIIFVAAVGIFINKDMIRRGADAGKSSLKIRLISPGSVVKTHIPLKFEWAGFKKFDHCILELFDVTLKPIWESPKISRSELILPPEIQNKLEPGQTYFWMVTVVLEDGTRIESSLTKFSLASN